MAYLSPFCSYLFSWLQKRFRPLALQFDPAKMTIVALEAISSSSGTNDKSEVPRTVVQLSRNPEIDDRRPNQILGTVDTA